MNRVPEWLSKYTGFKGFAFGLAYLLTLLAFLGLVRAFESGTVLKESQYLSFFVLLTICTYNVFVAFKIMRIKHYSENAAVGAGLAAIFIKGIVIPFLMAIPPNKPQAKTNRPSKKEIPLPGMHSKKTKQGRRDISE